ncbi:MAG: RNA methyltransferase [Bacteroidales bacterium]|nr:RNA methyltransferase [Bacteroidales bacterium]
MISKNQLKELCGYRKQKQCDEEGVFVVEGVKMCEEALASGFHIRAIAATSDWLECHGTTTSDAVYEVSDAALERLSGMTTPNKVWMLLCRPKEKKGDRRVTLEEGLVLALDRLQDPGNMGSIIRTADWYGVRHIFCSPDTVCCYNPKAVQASMGGLLRTRLHYTPLVPLLDEFLRNGHRVLGAMLDGEDVKRVATRDGEKPPVLVIGNESRGISPEVASRVSHRIVIPNRGGTAESLNASIAAAVLMDNLLR